MKESLLDCNEIELKDAPNQAFKTLLKYIYTGKMSLTSQKRGKKYSLVYGNCIEIADIDSLSTKIILTTKNKIALTLNNDIINIISGPIKHYYSADSIESDNKDDIMNFPIEFLHSQTPSGVPPHKLTLKIGTIVMLLRNLSPKKGLCNGTRLIIRHLHINFIDAEVLAGTNKGYRVFLPRIDLAPSDSQLPFTLKRQQFPIIPAFVITINKSQGQTFDHVGLFLPESVFAHGQLYVALTRCKSQNNMKIMILPSELQGKILKNDKTFTQNIIYNEILNS
ncbi:ATP-dependent DNA helicase PIF1-like [Gordionus sp. m RMFG-2023]|uniref:ATP-dependent DNA helicase PIF1-like n=1 Tax=Gordionus sp. m RMFG-2023 TaxID=3053472 RepID=UPI0031FC23DB